MAYGENLLSVKETVRESIMHNTSRGFIGWSSCDRICMDMYSCLEEGSKLFQAGDCLEGLEVMLFIFVEGAKLASRADSSSGMLTDVMTHALRLIGDCAQELSGQEKQMRDQAFAGMMRVAKRKAFDGWYSWRYDLLKCMICLCDEKHAGKMERELEALLEKADGSVFPEFERHEIWTVRYLLHRHLRGKEAVRTELYEHIDIDELCRIAVRDAQKEEDYDEAERLCLDKVKTKGEWCYRSSDPEDWNNLLFEIYRASGDTAKQAQQAKKLLLYGNETFWDILKELYQAKGTWGESFAGLLCELKSSGRTACFRSILIRENEIKRLLDDLTENPDDLFSYGGYLAGDYPEELYALCRQVICDSCGQARNRKEYRKVIKQIRQLLEWGGTDTARELVEELGQTYPRRMARLDELQRLRV